MTGGIAGMGSTAERQVSNERLYFAAIIRLRLRRAAYFVVQSPSNTIVRMAMSKYVAKS